jgi:predicted HTH transcriptional regulator
MNKHLDLFNDPPAWMRIDPKKDVHINSIKAYHEEHPKLSKRAAEILKVIRPGEQWTDRQLKDAMFGANADMNRVRPRITELIDIGMLRQTGQAKDRLTGKTVRVVGLP